MSGTSDDGEQPSSPLMKTIDGWNYNYAPTPPPAECMPDHEVGSPLPPEVELSDDREQPASPVMKTINGWNYTMHPHHPLKNACQITM